MVEANNGALPEASAAPRASAISCSSGTFTGRVVAWSSTDLIRPTSTPVPTTYTPSGRVSIASVAATMSTTSPTAALSSSDNSCLRTFHTEPSSLCTTAKVAVSGSTNNTAVR
ncbi:hypothetical protein MYIN104542_25540 [Mycobacterium intermedium]